MAYVFLMIAIVFELIGTSMLKASEGFTKLLPTLTVFIAFGIAFYSLSLSLKVIPLSVAYAMWSGIGTAATVLIGVLIWKEKISGLSVVGITLIIAGVILLNLNSSSHEVKKDIQVEEKVNV